MEERAGELVVGEGDEGSEGMSGGGGGGDGKGAAAGVAGGEGEERIGSLVEAEPVADEEEEGRWGEVCVWMDGESGEEGVGAEAGGGVDAGGVEIGDLLE